MTTHVRPMDWESIYREATGYLQQLLRIDTTNPPGNEIAAIRFLRGLLEGEGLACTVVEPAPSRANLICRLPAAEPSDAGPLLLTSHVDVVPAEAAQWTHPPFGGVIADGYIWGRGALDMKSKTILDLMTILCAKREGWPLRRDLIMTAVADEEVGCVWGSRYLVEHHPDLIRAEYALNEAGGYTTHINGRRFYPIQVAEKGVAWLKLTFRGEPGHGSKPHHDMAVAKLGRAIDRLTHRRLPLHVTPPAKALIDAIATASPLPRRWLLQGITHPRVGHFIEPFLPLNHTTAFLLATIRNTACPTVVQGGSADSINVIPSEVAVYLDGRIIPGQTIDDLLGELRALLGAEWTPTVLQYFAPSMHRHETPLFAMIKKIVEAADPGATVTPFLLSGFTDGHFYKKLGITTYGFQPIRCPPDYDSAAMPHAHDERIPVAGFQWGVQTYCTVVRQCCG